ncbi:TPA: hypothetical protein L6B08_07985 [Pseudomonas aeruginosa]|uniref:hypothetical protein n=1 Tax=Pseudomonas aeruginosa group TaxID=136841 RepID=UPI001F26D7F7|nr:hypothetical protein [Pseudomonas aeruginosa]MDG3709262.1 hypothetical protein [Pseudomonas aeruginosa]HBP6604159.1 hypothetical protein [Pseudomonas aeruginosa]HBP6819853.1 hypothetical protein [Pseudomonas aeruginosa]
MSNYENEQDLFDAMGRIIAQHADWLDGRTFQRLALHGARVWFSEDDIEDYGTFADLHEAFTKASEIALSIATGDHHG